MKKALEKTYDSTCDVKILKPNKINGITKMEESTILSNIPCKVSFSNISKNDETDKESKTSQIIKLFLSPEYKIEPGSKLVISKNNISTIYKNSGVPAIYDTHQEIMLEVWKDWA